MGADLMASAFGQIDARFERQQLAIAIDRAIDLSIPAFRRWAARNIPEWVAERHNAQLVAASPSLIKRLLPFTRAWGSVKRMLGLDPRRGHAYLNMVAQLGDPRTVSGSGPNIVYAPARVPRRPRNPQGEQPSGYMADYSQRFAYGALGRLASDDIERALTEGLAPILRPRLQRIERSLSRVPGAIRTQIFKGVA